MGSGAVLGGKGILELCDSTKLVHVPLEFGSQNASQRNGRRAGGHGRDGSQQMQDPTVLPSLAGGILIGLSASALLAAGGKIAGISGIVGGLLTPKSADTAWRAAFVGGLLTGGLMLAWFAPAAVAVTLPRSTAAICAAGVLVGFGSRLGNGCTSGHGVCGIARGSQRSLVATITFMATGAATALVITQFFGGRV